MRVGDTITVPVPLHRSASPNCESNATRTKVYQRWYQSARLETHRREDSNTDGRIAVSLDIANVRIACMTEAEFWGRDATTRWPRKDHSDTNHQGMVVCPSCKSLRLPGRYGCMTCIAIYVCDQDGGIDTE